MQNALLDDLRVLADEDGGMLELSAADAVDVLAALEPAAGFEGWADVELMGHRTRVAYVKPIEIAHRGFLDLTWRKGEIECREIYSPTAVFCLTPLEDEEQARKLLEARDDIPF